MSCCAAVGEVDVDGPRPDELLFAIAMACGPRIHDRMGGLAAADISVWDGQR